VRQDPDLRGIQPDWACPIQPDREWIRVRPVRTVCPDHGPCDV